MIFLPTSIRVEDLKDPAQLLLRSAHHHRKLRLYTLYFFQSSFSLISSTLWRYNYYDYSHVLLKVHAATVVLVKHPVHRVTQDAPLCDNNHCLHAFLHYQHFFCILMLNPHLVRELLLRDHSCGIFLHEPEEIDLQVSINVLFHTKKNLNNDFCFSRRKTHWS